ncbi:TPA: DUF3304 domain-containing protein [Salmonella enterica]|nr:DUF3304 domain-containing protein [Salmonella enterica]HCC3864072.1 DUF3304 domain-containing protein [Salmonella enterica]HCC3879583.1 DUF3304 domain-containing protein [Salmonella enterica]HCC3965106.1 DUF3304 domain-containing protein [Salmonella enterica]HCC4014872.1 DUF3304 domain-containing protein [Salmonella enterica]
MFSGIIKSVLVLLFMFTVSGCAKGSNDYNAGDLSGINHTQQGINYFTVNGYRAGLTGNSCCIMLPRKWTPGLKAHVEWETAPPVTSKIPEFSQWDAYLEWEKKYKASYRKHSAIVDIPKYTETCGMTVHFLPCNQVKVTTSCVGYGTPDYPIKEPLDMKEPAQCPK